MNLVEIDEPCRFLGAGTVYHVEVRAGTGGYVFATLVYGDWTLQRRTIRLDQGRLDRLIHGRRSFGARLEKIVKEFSHRALWLNRDTPEQISDVTRAKRMLDDFVRFQGWTRDH